MSWGKRAFSDNRLVCQPQEVAVNVDNYLCNTNVLSRVKCRNISDFGCQISGKVIIDGLADSADFEKSLDKR